MPIKVSMNKKVQQPERFILKITQCSCCQRAGHSRTVWRCKTEICRYCAEHHAVKKCPLAEKDKDFRKPNDKRKCTSCLGKHKARYLSCQYLQNHRDVLKIATTTKTPYKEALQRCKTATGISQADKSQLQDQINELKKQIKVFLTQTPTSSNEKLLDDMKEIQRSIQQVVGRMAQMKKENEEILQAIKTERELLRSDRELAQGKPTEATRKTTEKPQAEAKAKTSQKPHAKASDPATMSKKFKGEPVLNQTSEENIEEETITSEDGFDVDKWFNKGAEVWAEKEATLKMPGPFSLNMIDIVHNDQDNKKQQFVQDTEDFPCLFNLGSCKLDIGSQKYTGQNVCEIDVPPNKWKSLLEDLNDDSEVSECDNEVWKDNLLTYVYAELGEYGKAFKLNKKIKDQHGMNNLVALVNASFLLFRTGNLIEAYAMLNDFKKLKTQQTFADLKIDAICELGYAFRKLAGAKNLQFSISFLEFVLLFHPCDEQIQLMLAIVYRRCTHFHIYSADPENINRRDFALKAATSLFKLGTTSKNTSFKAAALIELAFLKYGDDMCDESNCGENHRILSREEWFQIVQLKSWKQLCEEATEICDDGPSEKVLKIAGQLYRYYDDDECLDKSEHLLKNAIAKRPSNRAHHHLGLTYKKMAVRHDLRNNMNRTHLEDIQDAIIRYNVGVLHQQGFANGSVVAAGGYACGCRLNVLPQPSTDNSPQQLEKHLKYVAKVPDQFTSFSKDNPYTDKAIHHLKQAVKLSCFQNKKAVYDLACILVQAEDYKKSKETCNILIKECASLKILTADSVYLVNAYNLYGICCAKEAEAEVNQVNKEQFLAESEEHLTVAVRLASCLAASVPELEMCATDLWNAFRTLQKKFKFEGRKESREKLFRICEYISDYRFLEAVDDIVSQDLSELEKIEVIEQCLRRYLNMKAYNSALLFRDLVSLQPGVKPKLSNSKVYRQLVLEVAEGKLDETYLERNTGACHPDHVWKQLFTDEFCVTEKSKKYDIVIVSDVDDNYELKKGIMSNISKYLKLVLLETFGLSVVRAHEEAIRGTCTWNSSYKS